MKNFSGMPLFIFESSIYKSALERQRQQEKDAAHVKMFNETFGTSFKTRKQCDEYNSKLKQ